VGGRLRADAATEYTDANAEETDALDALIALGYGVQDAREALARVREGAKTTSEKVKEALKILS